MKRTVTVIIERDVDGGYIASVAELPGCHTQGDTMEELRANIAEAIELYLEDEDLGGKLPEFVGIERVEVSV
ncbi:MAG: type II toxin-antitoxin system HicB family antitoxin [Methanobacteriota archaeon]